MIKIIFQMFHHPPRIAKCHDGYICIKKLTLLGWNIWETSTGAGSAPHSTTGSGVLLFVCTPLYIWRKPSLSRAALCSAGGTPPSLPYWQSLAIDLVSHSFTLLQLLGLAKLNVMLNKAPLDLSCHSTDVSWEFQPIKITLSQTRYFYSNFRCRLAQQSFLLLLHRSLENLLLNRSFGHPDIN